MHYNVQQQKQIKLLTLAHISSQQFIRKLHNFMHIISVQSNAAAMMLSGSGQIHCVYPATSSSAQI